MCCSGLWLLSRKDDELVRIHLTLQPAVDLETKNQILHGIYIADISEVRLGACSFAYAKGKHFKNFNACLSLIGSEGCLDLEFEDKEERDWWAERLEILIDEYEMVDRKRMKVVRLATLSPSGRRKPFNFNECVEVKLLQKDLEAGIQVKKYGRDGRMERRKLYLAFHNLTTTSKKAPRPRLLYLRSDELIDELDYDDNKGIDICDICEIRAGLQSYNFNKAKYIYDIKKIRSKAITIIGSERTMSFEIIEGDHNPDEIKDRILNGLELLRYSFKRLLGNFGQEDKEIAEFHRGKILMAVSRSQFYLFKDRVQRRLDEQMVVSAQSTVGVSAALTITEENLQRPVTKADIQAYRRSFTLFDTDNSGSIDATEMMKAMKELGRDINMTESKRIIKEFDNDNSGTIDIDEFIIMMRQTNKVDENVEALLNLYPALYPNKRLITVEEFTSIMNRHSFSKEETMTLSFKQERVRKKGVITERITYFYEEDEENSEEGKSDKKESLDKDDRFTDEQLAYLGEFADLDGDGMVFPQDFTYWLVQSLAD